MCNIICVKIIYWGTNFCKVTRELILDKCCFGELPAQPWRETCSRVCLMYVHLCAPKLLTRLFNSCLETNQMFVADTVLYFTEIPSSWGLENPGCNSSPKFTLHIPKPHLHYQSSWWIIQVRARYKGHIVVISMKMSIIWKLSFFMKTLWLP